MSKRQTRWAETVRQQILEVLGGQCWACGKSSRLHIDHPFGRDWEPSSTASSWRASIYRRELHEGKLRLLCAGCNSSKKFDRSFLPPPLTAQLPCKPLRKLAEEPF